MYDIAYAYIATCQNRLAVLIIAYVLFLVPMLLLLLHILQVILHYSVNQPKIYNDTYDFELDIH